MKRITFQHIVLKGSHYDVGQTQGACIAQNPQYKEWYTSSIHGQQTLNDSEFKKAVAFLKKYTPGIHEELSGIADALHVDPHRLIYYAFTYKPQTNCSHMAVLPDITDTGHLYVGRSYEWSLDHSLQLCTTRVQGKAAHIGFSLVESGRLEGINEHGLCITMTAGAPLREITEGGIMFWAVVRTVLDTCSTVDEALETIDTIPIAFFCSFILADSTGKATLVEIACSKRAQHTIDSNSEKQFIHSTNHFTLDNMRNETPRRMRQSIDRYNAINSRIQTDIPHVSKKTLRSILTDTMPAGVSAHYYNDTFGTLWSIIFDVSEKVVDVCFGPPRQNSWHTFGLDDPAGIREYTAVCPEENSVPELWQHIPLTEEK